MGLGHFLHGTPLSSTRGLTTGRARTYELMSVIVFAGRRRRVFGQLVRLSGAGPGDRVLDVGCGTGYLTGLVAAAVAPTGTVIGIDASPPMIHYARRSRAGANCSFEVGLAEALQTPDASMDRVVTSFLLHHLPDDLQPQAMREILRVLRPGGTALLADFRSPRTRHGRHLLNAAAGYGLSRSPAHELAQLCRELGFLDVQAGDLQPFIRYVRATRPA